jgi:hypothetical protein
MSTKSLAIAVGCVLGLMVFVAQWFVGGLHHEYEWLAA